MPKHLPSRHERSPSREREDVVDQRSTGHLSATDDYDTRPRTYSPDPPREAGR